MFTLLLALVVTLTCSASIEDEGTPVQINRLICTPVQINRLIVTVTSEEITWEERHEAEKKLNELPAVKVLPALFPCYARRNSDPTAVDPRGRFTERHAPRAVTDKSVPARAEPT
jgi:hypothetical protein